MEEALIRNEVKLRGKIVKKVLKDNGKLYTVLGVRSSEKKSPRKKMDYPLVYWFDEMAETVKNAYDEGDVVEIDARVHTKKGEQQSVIGVDINDAKRGFDEKFGTHGIGPYMEDYNEVRIAGEFFSFYKPVLKTGNIGILTLKLCKDNRYTFPKISVYGAKMQAYLQDMQQGEPVAVIGHIQTKDTEKDGKKWVRRFITAHYIVKI